MIHSITRVIEIIAILGCVSSSVYYIFCLWSVVEFLKASKPDETGRLIPALPPVSILKPLKGVDPEIYESFRSHCLQDYPEYEIIFGVSDAADPAVASVKQLKRGISGKIDSVDSVPQYPWAKRQGKQSGANGPIIQIRTLDRQRQRYSRGSRLSLAGS